MLVLVLVRVCFLYSALLSSPRSSTFHARSCFLPFFAPSLWAQSLCGRISTGYSTHEQHRQEREHQELPQVTPKADAKMNCEIGGLYALHHMSCRRGSSPSNNASTPQWYFLCASHPITPPPPFSHCTGAFFHTLFERVSLFFVFHGRFSAQPAAQVLLMRCPCRFSASPTISHFCFCYSLLFPHAMGYGVHLYSFSFPYSCGYVVTTFARVKSRSRERGGGWASSRSLPPLSLLDPCVFLSFPFMDSIDSTCVRATPW